MIMIVIIYYLFFNIILMTIEGLWEEQFLLTDRAKYTQDAGIDKSQFIFNLKKYLSVNKTVNSILNFVEYKTSWLW